MSRNRIEYSEGKCLEMQLSELWFIAYDSLVMSHMNKYKMQRLQDENAELRADVKFLMDQHTLMVDYMTRNSAEGNFQQPLDNSLVTSHGHRSLIPEVSNLITSVNQLTSHNFELLKRVPEITGNIGPIKKSPFSIFIS